MIEHFIFEFNFKQEQVAKQLELHYLSSEWLISTSCPQVAVHYSREQLKTLDTRYSTSYQDKLMMNSSCLCFSGSLEWWHARFTDFSSQHVTSSSVWGYWTSAHSFYLLWRVQRPQQTHKHLVSECSETPEYQCPPSCCCTCLVNKMIRTMWLGDISKLLRGGLERRGCIVSQKQSVAAEKCVFWKGPAVCWGGGRGQRAGELWAPPQYDFCSPDGSLLRAL